MAFCLVAAEGRGLVLHTRMRFVVHEDARVKHVARWQRGLCTVTPTKIGLHGLVLWK